MRAELPPLCRPMGVAHGPSSPSNLGPLCNQETGEVNRLVACGANYQSSNHRAFAQAEERFLWLVSKHSLARLADSLAEPMLKLDEVNIVSNHLSLSLSGWSLDQQSFFSSSCASSRSAQCKVRPQTALQISPSPRGRDTSQTRGRETSCLPLCACKLGPNFA